MISAFPYEPGVQTHRISGTYDSYQQALWEAWSDACYAGMYGFAETRHPSADFQPNPEKFDQWREKVIANWAAEAHRIKGSRGADMNEMPLHWWLYLYERMLDADRLKPLVRYMDPDE